MLSRVSFRHDMKRICGFGRPARASPGRWCSGRSDQVQSTGLSPGQRETQFEPSRCGESRGVAVITPACVPASTADLGESRARLQSTPSPVPCGGARAQGVLTTARCASQKRFLVKPARKTAFSKDQGVALQPHPPPPLESCFIYCLPTRCPAQPPRGGVAEPSSQENFRGARFCQCWA
uniref:Uncharacterized protein n=1 Tax=Molossus molossus TaxID=27622 RepID=A0A7J8HHD1_MOLMO|nr:hypothetical protein HJG59_011070 [Molossus molossus]